MKASASFNSAYEGNFSADAKYKKRMQKGVGKRFATISLEL